ncbi:MAG TPA: 6-phosphogluconolactonase [Candidatus Sulfotelmatobacter sp.]|nr:6-phosphogluconolactonase [Candidatus Sulfotelmatobacter sp.]
MHSYDVFKDAGELADYVASLSVDLLSKAVQNQGYAVWVVAGGSTPSLAYGIISTKYASSLDWSKVYVILGDERVSEESSDSNWLAIKEELLDKLAFDAHKLITPKHSGSLESAASDYTKKLEQLFTSLGNASVDLMWLGMGEDGHTLSFFPGQEDLFKNKDLVVAVSNSPKPPPGRISLNPFALEETKCCLLIAAGQGKAWAIEELTKEDKTLPISRTLQAIASSGGDTRVLLDKDASARV